MHVEVSVALNFVISYLYNKLPRRRVDMFAEELEKGIKRKFEGHWYPDNPLKGTAFRCIRMSGEKVDPVIINAAKDCRLDESEINAYLPNDLMIWIDPNEVSYRISEKGQIKVLYSEKKSEPEGFDHLDREIQAASVVAVGNPKGFNPEAQCFRPIDSLSSSLSHISLSPSSPIPSNGWTSPSFNSTSTSSTAPASSPVNNHQHVFLPKSNSIPNFTAATFAQTKFGSTKLKSQAKRPSRLSPTDVGMYIKQRNVNVNLPLTAMNQNRPRSLSPRNPRPDFFDPQQLIFPPQQQQPGLTGMPMGGEMYSPVNQPFSLFPDVVPNNGSVMNGYNNMPSPDAPKGFVEGLNLHNMAYPSQIQHLLVAN